MITSRVCRALGSLGVLALLSSATVACQDQSEAMCDGVPADFGGCDADQPTYAGTDCEELGRQFGVQVEQRHFRAIADHPPDRSAAVASNESLGLVTARLSQHLQGQDVSCDPQVVFEAAEGEFSEEFWASAPIHVYDNPEHGGPPWDVGRDGYEEWLLENLENIRWRESLEQEQLPPGDDG